MDINKYTLKQRWSAKHLLRVSSLMPEDIFEVLHFARYVRRRTLAGERVCYLKGKTVAVLSCSPLSPAEKFTLGRAIKTLGGSPVYLPDCDGEGFPADDVCAVERAGADCIVLKGFRKSQIRDAERRVKTPLVNLSSDTAAPCQALADLFTLWEAMGTFADKKLAVIGAESAAVNSLLCGAVKAELSVFAAFPEDVKPDPGMLENTAQFGDICFADADECMRRADAVYTDRDKRDRTEYTVDAVAMSFAKPEAVFLHPLPLGRGRTVTDDVADGENSLVMRQAENLLYIFEALFGLLLGESEEE